MIRINNLSKQYGKQTLFENINFQMIAGEHLGLVGRNGHGKSTLFKIILGEEEADEGNITYPKNYKIGHLAQHLNFTEKTILEEGCLGLPEDEKDYQYKVEMILFGLGFSKSDMERAPSEFSGGYQIRLNLTKLLVSNPNLLLLDEPTNYLDIVSIRWITDFLRDWENEFILISHDRDFMDSVTNHTAAIHRHKLRKVKGGTEKLYAQILQEEEIHEKTRVTEEKKRKQEEAFINRFRAQASKAAAVQSRIKRLEKMPSLEQLAHLEHLEFEFQYAPIHAQNLMQVNDLTFYYDEENPLIENLSFNIQAEDRIAIIGKNGKGKSTLLNLLANELTPISGEIKRHDQLQMGLFGQTNIQRLQNNLTVEDEVYSANPNLGRTVVRSICGTMMFSGEKAEKKVAVLSGGEKSRVLLGKILAKPTNFLLLDEPTNHLDMESIETLIESIQDFPGAVVIVTHSEMILKAVATKLVVFQHGKTEFFNGNYEEFLEKIGWEEDENDSVSTAKKTKKSSQEKESNPDKKELRKQRADLIAEKAKALNPLKQEIELLEKKIQEIEEKIKKVNQELIDCSQSNQVDNFVTLSKFSKELQKEMDESYQKLELKMTQLEEKSKKYEELEG